MPLPGKPPATPSDADRRYWQDVVRFRWVATAAYFAMTSFGLLPWSMPWHAIAGGLLVASTVAYTAYRRRTSEYSLYQDIAGYVDIAVITLILISVGTVDHPMWVAYIFVVPAVTNFKRSRYNAVFTAFTLVAFGIAYLATDVMGDGGLSADQAIVTGILLAFIAYNSSMISANNFRLRDVIEAQARTDALTGLANRRRLFDTMDSLTPGERPLAVMMIDLDDFKMLNEALGHLTADRMLAQLAAAMGRVLPSGALAARYGGDEFAVLVEVEGAAEAEELAGELIAVARDEVGIGLTAGIALCPGDAPTLERALSLADNNLRLAKLAGKRRALHRAA